MGLMATHSWLGDGGVEVTVLKVWKWVEIEHSRLDWTRAKCAAWRDWRHTCKINKNHFLQDRLNAIFFLCISHKSYQIRMTGLTTMPTGCKSPCGDGRWTSSWTPSKAAAVALLRQLSQRPTTNSCWKPWRRWSCCSWCCCWCRPRTTIVKRFSWSGAGEHCWRICWVGWSCGAASDVEFWLRKTHTWNRQFSPLQLKKSLRRQQQQCSQLLHFLHCTGWQEWKYGTKDCYPYVKVPPPPH